MSGKPKSSAGAAGFRGEVRDWLEANCPPAMRSRAREDEIIGGGSRQVFPNEDGRLWLERMAERGWTAPGWPKEYGGGGLDRDELQILQEEMLRLGARPPLAGMGLSMIGPTLLDYGTEAQKREHLPGIVSGRVRWCQGYSEPGAGSDLASLQTRCEDKGDHFLVNGHKIWTSGAQHADWIFTLVRTEPQAPKHEGISFVLIDMDQPGVKVKPIKLISGNSPFCETFFADARGEKRNLVGRLNRGWEVGKRLLQHERSSLSGLSSGGARDRLDGMRELPSIAREYVGLRDGRLADASLRDEILQSEMNRRALRLTQQRAVAENESGETPSFATSMFKYYASEQLKLRLELQLKAVGTRSLGWEGEGFSAEELALTRIWLRAKAFTIAGGSSEIQLNILARRVLGLPD